MKNSLQLIRLMKWSVMLTAFLFSTATLTAQTIVYVNAAALGSNTGADWTNAYTSFESALAIADANVATAYEIRVAEGTYKPTNQQSGGARDAMFAIKRNKLKILGGYSSTGNGTRDIAANPTILSGDIGTPNTNSDNSYHVMVLANIPNSVTDSLIIEGFTFKDAFAAALGSIVINGQTIDRINGGGIYLRSVSANTVIKNCIITGNYANESGGGMYNSSSSAAFANCIITGNYADVSGGGMYNSSSSPVLTNCVLSSNTSMIESGGGMYNNSSSPVITNCTISGNYAGLDGGGIFNENSSNPNVRNTIILGNNTGVHNINSAPDYSYSLLQGFTGITSADVFVNPVAASQNTPTAAGDYTLKAGSPAINAGNNAVVTTTTDVAGNARIQNTTVDIGAYESAYAGAYIPSVLYVNASATSGGNGESWTTAYTSFEDALAFAHASTSVDSILVAGGTYKPTNLQGGGVRDATFAIARNNLKIYGGYSSTGNGTRDITANPTILSGDIGIANDNTDNSYHVMVLAGVSNSATDSLIIEGFTITGGNANGGLSISISGQTINRNSGGGIYLRNVSANTAIRQCIITGNTASSTGGGMYNNSSSPVFNSCVISNNITLIDGGGIYNISSSPAFTNCLISGNMAGGNGGGMYNYASSSPVLTNCTISGNRGANDGGGIHNYDGSNPSVRNTIILGNSTGVVDNGTTSVYSYSLVQGLSNTANGNIDATGITAAVVFVNPVAAASAPTTAGDYKLKIGSPAIDMGNNAVVTTATDIAGNIRIQNTTVDLGAYESTPIPSVLYVNAAATGSNTGLDWTNAYTSFEDALAVANASTAVDSILVAGGTYKPTNQQGGGARDATFAITKNGLRILGGYSSTGNGTRDIAANPTILSGGIGVANDSLDNSYHVMVLANVPNSATDSLIIEGFTITDGNANVVSTISINGQTINRYTGGGIYSNAISSNVSLRQLMINDNNSVYGGGMYNLQSTLSLLNSVISNNTANTYGAGVFNSQVSPTFINCNINSNNAGSFSSDGGGGMYNEGTSSLTPVIINSTITKNYGSGIVNLVSEITVHNSIIFGNSGGYPFEESLFNSNVTYSLIETFTTSANNNIDYTTVTSADIFVNPANDFRLKAGSPAIDAGSNALVPSGISTDVLGNDRIVGSVVDLGAYEYNAALPLRLLSFDGKRTNGINNLVWKTANESNLTNYEVQYSKNALEFSTVQMVKANNNSSSIYTVSHNPPEAGREAKFYYRIKINENDGKVSYSKIVTLADNNQQSTINIYPNPARSIVNIKLTDNSLQNTEVVVLNAQGKQVLKTIIKSTNQSINLSTLQPAIYFLRFANGEVQKLIKE